ncbi:stromal interaction molecule 1-like [Acropora palmata]|uniref:stromal interaction molecule 1-like n=1 Tax=Acropora palmata TaxID=6131 RepID=UPI003DA1541C
MVLSRMIYLLFSGLVLNGISMEGRGQTRTENLTNDEKLIFDAVTKIHLHLDDDRNGKVDLSESNEFMRDELKVTDTDRHSHFHGDDDLISVEELWKSWVQSEVNNWTSQDVVNWLVNSVHLPQYAEVFSQASINGSAMPRLAIENGLLQELGIKDSKHRKKIGLRAMDIVLFGPPFISGHSLLKDVVVAFSVLVATIGCWIAVLQKRKAKEQMERMIKDMKILQQAEDGLQELQIRLAKAEEDHQMAIRDKLDLEVKLKEEMQITKSEAQQLTEARVGTEEQMQRLKLAEKELAQVQQALKKAEKELEYKSWKAPSVLKQWLLITFDKETKHFQQKRTVALKQMKEAKEACERIKKKRGSLMGSLRLAHDLSIDEVDQKILSARSALADVTNELEERQHRWSQIEYLCGLQIMSQTSFGVGSAMRDRSGSAIAQALVNVANVAGVSSGRKISASASPWTSSPDNTNVEESNEDLPPTYSIATADGRREKSCAANLKDSVNLSKQDNGCSDCSGSSGTVVRASESLTSNPRSSHPKHCLGAEAVVNGFAGSEITLVTLERSSSTSGHSAEEHPTANGNLSDSLSGKSKKRLSWFGKRQDSVTESESSSTNENEEEARRKIRWLWRSAVRKSKAQSGTTNKSDQEMISASSLEKLKSG